MSVLDSYVQGFAQQEATLPLAQSGDIGAATEDIIAQHEARVERYERGSGAEWVFHEAVGESSSLTLDAVGATLVLSDVYADLPAGA